MPDAKPAKKELVWRGPFLTQVAAGASVKKACAAAGVSRQSVHEHANRNDDFRQAWADAKEAAKDTIRDEIFRRAVEGADKPVFHQGKQAATVKEFDSTLLIFLAKKRIPEEYGDHVTVEQTGQVDPTLGDAARLADGEKRGPWQAQLPVPLTFWRGSARRDQIVPEAELLGWGSGVCRPAHVVGGYGAKRARSVGRATRMRGRWPLRKGRCAPGCKGHACRARHA
jgi:hypothetical protein